MAQHPAHAPRSIGLLGATGVGLGAIVGGGILVLAGAAFSATGPSAIIAFALNGVIAVMTALTFAELATSFPESGGAYLYAKKVLSLRVAFAVGWVVWFAYIVAGVLYALGFAEYAVAMVREGIRLAWGEPPRWLGGRVLVDGLAVGATLVYSLALIRKASGGGQGVTIGKVVVFAVLVAGGLWALSRRAGGTAAAGLSPLLPNGTLGLLQAMGFTFIALQGFEVIATVAGEVRQPRRTLPRAMLLSLGAALVIYLPLLFVIPTVGVAPGGSIKAMSDAAPETVMAVAVRNYLGPVGYWLVMLAAVLSTLSALQANILAASRVALTMARDSTLPGVLAGLHERRGTPVMAIYASSLALVVILLLMPDLAAAGAAASLIFLVAFALAHATGYLARRRGGGQGAYRTPLFPLVPLAGGAACVGLALFQAVAVPAAGGVALVWLALGVMLYVALFARRARLVDAFAEAADPDLVRFRGHNPLVLVPVANPANAPVLVELAGALAPPEVGRALLLSVVRRPEADASPAAIEHAVAAAQQVLSEALTRTLTAGRAPEALVTTAASPLEEIVRVANSYHCDSLLIGLHRLDEAARGTDGSTPVEERDEGTPPAVPRIEPTERLTAAIERLLNDVHCDVAVLRAVPGWRLEQAKRILIPVGGKGADERLRARLLGSLCRAAERQLTFLRVLPAAATDAERAQARLRLERLAALESPRPPEVVICCDDDAAGAIAARANTADLLVLGLPRSGGRKLIGAFAVRLAGEVRCPTVMISRGDRH